MVIPGKIRATNRVQGITIGKLNIPAVLDYRGKTTLVKYMDSSVDSLSANHNDLKNAPPSSLACP